MNRNPVIPYIIIMVFGFSLIFFLSVKGIGDSKQIAKERDPEAAQEEAADTEEFDPEAHAEQSCISCHGGDYEGGAGPALTNLELSDDEIKKILVEGQGMMPGGLVPEENLDEMVEWLKTLE